MKGLGQFGVLATSQDNLAESVGVRRHGQPKGTRSMSLAQQTRPADHSQERLIRAIDAAHMLGCSRATFWRRVADETIPRPLKIGGTSRWLISDILAVIEMAKASRA
jgi:predicted DNA-binding transcriptional regulator AlpA